MSKPCKPRQDLVVVLDGARVKIDGGSVRTTHVIKGELRVFNCKGHLCARFAAGQWQYMYAAEVLATS